MKVAGNDAQTTIRTMALSRKARAFWPVAQTVLLADCTSKVVAVRELTPAHVPHPVLGDCLRFALTYNSAAAMSLSLGPFSQPILGVARDIALVGRGPLPFPRTLFPNCAGRR